MDGKKSISQGAFLSLPPGFGLSKLRRRRKRKASESESYEEWETAFTRVWKSIEEETKEMNEKLFGKVLEKLVKHVGSIGSQPLAEGSIPCELLLTGTNLPDHKLLLDSLTKHLVSQVTPHVATLWSSGSLNLKSAVQNFVRQIVKIANSSTSDTEDSEEEEDDEDCVKSKKIQKLKSGQLSMATLLAWYTEHSADKKSPVVIIIPDFETFSPAVLGDFIELLCSYEKEVPFVLVLSVATSPATVYQSLPRATMARLVVQLFYSEASPTFLNHVIEKVLLDDKCPFKLGSRTITFLTDVFLFHSFSVKRFIQGFKFCMMEHFYRKDYMKLCCPEEKLPKLVSELNPIDVENIRKLQSFKKHVESCDLPERKRLLLDDSYTKVFILKSLRFLHTHVSDFHIVLKCLNILSRDLPGAPIGRHVRELYSRSVGSKIIDDKDYKQVLALVAIQAKSELLTKVASILNLLKIDNILDILSEDTNRFETAISKLEKLKTEMEKPPPETNGNSGQRDFTQELVNLLSKELFEPFLIPPTSLALHEILYFDELPAVRRRISGAPRSAIHTALNNPHHYLECDCCELPFSDAIQASLPDLSITYKLYLESNRTINLRDWFQAFHSVVQPNAITADNGGVDQKIQARFTRAVSELQFLGFIKPSKSKVDYVTRNTFGNM